MGGSFLEQVSSKKEQEESGGQSREGGFIHVAPEDTVWDFWD